MTVCRHDASVPRRKEMRNKERQKVKEENLRFLMRTSTSLHMVVVLYWLAIFQ